MEMAQELNISRDNLKKWNILHQTIIYVLKSQILITLEDTKTTIFCADKSKT